MHNVVAARPLELERVEIHPVGARWQIRVCYWDADRGSHVWNGHNTPLYADKHAAGVAAEELALEADTGRKVNIVWC